MTDQAWWAKAFDASYVARYGHRSDDAAREEIAGLVPHLRSAPGPVMDACCGNGRHLQAMRDAGVNALGFDWSLPLLAHALGRANLGPRSRVARGDMRQPPLASGWGAITMLFTAFGYFDDESNAATFAAFTRLLAPNGWFILDLANAQLVRDSLVPASQRTLNDGTVVDERRWLDDRYVCKRSTWNEAGVEQQADERVRLYDIPEIADLARRSGCQLQSTWTSLQGPDQDTGRHVHWIQQCAV